jgi:hypothetical protein
MEIRMQEESEKEGMTRTDKISSYSSNALVMIFSWYPYLTARASQSGLGLVPLRWDWLFWSVLQLGGFASVFGYCRAHWKVPSPVSVRGLPCP